MDRIIPSTIPNPTNTPKLSPDGSAVPLFNTTTFGKKTMTNNLTFKNEKRIANLSVRK